MATERTTTQGTTRSRAQNGGNQDAGTALDMAVREARGALEGVSRSVPELARASRSAMDDMVRTIEGGSDERLSAGVTLTLGLTIGMLIGGAPRLLVAAALVPLAVMGFTLADRRSRAARGARAGTAA